MKKVMILLIVLMVMVGCSDQNDKVKIGVIQLADHPSLNATYAGMKEVLDEKYGEDGYELTYQNALGDNANLMLMAQKLVDDGSDLIYAIATSAAQTAMSVTEGKEIPVIYNAVTDPISAGLQGEWIAGVSDMAPIDKQLNLIKEILPEVKSIGILYNTGEDNSLIQIEMVTDKALEIGLDVISVGVSSPSDIETAASQLVKKVDALFNITDNMVVSATSQVVNVANQANIPVFASEVGQFDQGILATESIDYFDLGLMAGEMIYNVLTSEVSIKDLDHMVSEDTVLYFNLDVAEKLGIGMPESIKSRLK